MDDIFSDMAEFCRAYLTILSFSVTLGRKFATLAPSHNLFKTSRLDLKNNKCQTNMTSCSYLEHTDGKGEIAPQMAKVEAVRTFQQPVSKNVCELSWA